MIDRFFWVAAGCAVIAGCASPVVTTYTASVPVIHAMRKKQATLVFASASSTPETETCVGHEYPGTQSATLSGLLKEMASINSLAADQAGALKQVAAEIKITKFFMQCGTSPGKVEMIGEVTFQDGKRAPIKAIKTFGFVLNGYIMTSRMVTATREAVDDVLLQAVAAMEP